MDKHTVDRFAELFSGNKAVYGIHVPEESTVPGEKAKGRSFTKEGAVTRKLYEEHIRGVKSIGIVPVDENSNVRFCALDVDVYPLDPQTYIDLIEAYKLPLFPFKSKSGGLHLYMFFSEDTKATDAVALLAQFRVLFGLPESTEMFPKQLHLGAGAKGNWINLPYYKGGVTERYMYDAQGARTGIDEAVQKAYAGRVTKQLVETHLQVLPFAPAPPCLQSLYLSGGASAEGRNRNVFLFNVATYLKARYGDEFTSKLAMVNESLDVPLPSQELDSTIVRSHAKNNYGYQCRESVLKMYCDKDLCKAREFGVGGDKVSDFSYERLVQVKTHPPYYLWTINGVEMAFYSERALRNQDAVADLCMRHLHKVPNMLKRDTWNRILSTAFQNIEQIQPEVDELSEASLLRAYLTEFLIERSVSSRPSQITMGQVYKWDERQLFVFRSADLLRFLYNTKNFRVFGSTELNHALKRDYEAKSSKLYIPDIKQTIRAWTLPYRQFTDMVGDNTEGAEELLCEEYNCVSDDGLVNFEKDENEEEEKF